jgi:hypothetical protein
MPDACLYGSLTQLVEFQKRNEGPDELIDEEVDRLPITIFLADLGLEW